MAVLRNGGFLTACVGGNRGGGGARNLLNSAPTPDRLIIPFIGTVKAISGNGPERQAGLLSLVQEPRSTIRKAWGISQFGPVIARKQGNPGMQHRSFLRPEIHWNQVC